MSISRTRNSTASGGPADTAELPAVKAEQLPGDSDPLDRTDSWASTDSWKLGAEQQRDLEREAELGTLRSNLATMAESHGYLENSLHSLTTNLRDLESRLLGESSRTAGLEGDLRTRETQLANMQKELEAGRAQWTGGQAERAALLQQVQALQESGAAQMRAIELLEAARQSDQDAQQAMLLEHEARAAALSRAQLREQQLQESLTALETSHAELRAQLEMMGVLNEQLDLARRGQEQALDDLKIAAERIRAADVELRNRDSRIERLGASESEHKSRAENFARRLAERDGLIQRLEREAESSAAVLGKIQSNLGARLDKDESALPRDLVARLLVRNDGNTEIVQVLGRRTLIGRGVDCQLQIDADFVSRRHALVLVMPDETVIEDLNSTNGVYVNGTRIARRRLAEGDNIAIGKTLFRYVLKPVSERGS
jgi:hypothetical protein